MLKTILRIIIVIGLLTILTNILPVPITAKMDGAIIYFLSSIWALNGLFNVATFFQCLEVFSYFVVSLITYYLIMFFVEGKE